MLALIPPGGPDDYILLMGVEDSVAAAIQQRLGYSHVATWTPGAFDLERDFYPYPNAHFRAILCFDLLEGLTADPMHMMDEIHRVLRPGCTLVLTTRRYTREQIRGLLENCGLEVTAVDANDESTFAAGRKVGHLRERYPNWLYPDR